MTKRRLISIGIAVFVAVSVMLLGKACMEDIIETNKRSSKNKVNTYTPQYSGQESTYPGQYGDNQEITTEEITTVPVEVVTNILGEIVGTVPPTTVPDINTPVDEENTEPTTRKSILDSANDPEQSTTSSNKILKENNNIQQPDVPPANNSSESDKILIHVD